MHRSFRVFLCVFLVHISLLVSGYLFHDVALSPKPQQRITIKTIELKARQEPPPTTISQAPKPQESPKKAPPSKEQAVQPKKSEKPKETSQENRAQLLQKAKESIAKIRKSEDNSSPAKTSKLPAPVEHLKTDNTTEQKQEEEKETLYLDELVGRLKLSLRLPEYGEVKVQLTLDRSGTIVKLAVTSAESKENQRYLEEMLPTLTFAPFGKAFGKESQHTFLISLNNED